MTTRIEVGTYRFGKFTEIFEHMERLSEARQKIDEARSIAQQAQSERVKAAGSLLKRLSFSDAGSKPANDPDSLPNSPARLPSSSRLPPVSEAASSSAKPGDSFWRSVVGTDKKNEVIAVSASSKSVKADARMSSKGPGGLKDSQTASISSSSDKQEPRQSSKAPASINRAPSKSQIGASLVLSSGSEDEKPRKSSRASINRAASKSQIGASLVLSSGSEDGISKSNNLAASIKRSNSSAKYVKEESSSDSEIVEIPTIERRASLMDMLSTARKTVAEMSFSRKSAPNSPLPSVRQSIAATLDPNASENSLDETVVHDATLLRRGEACHCFFLVLQKLNIPSDVAWLRVVLKRWRKPQPQALRTKLSPLVSCLTRNIIKLTASAFWRFQLSAASYRHANKAGEVVDFWERGIQTDARRQFDHVLGLGKLSRVINHKVDKSLMTFFDKLRVNRKKQMEIAFLRAVIAELKRREI